MMDVVSRILSPFVGSWVAWVMVSLLCLMLCNQVISSSISMIWRSWSSHSERMYTGAMSQSVVSVVLSYVFRVGVMAMGVYLCVYDSGDFLLMNYIKLLGVLTIVLLVQWVLWQLMSFVFLPFSQRKNAWEQRVMIYNASCVLLWGILLIIIGIPNALLQVILMVILGILWIGLLMVKGLQMFYRKPWDVLYVLLYSITLEVLPVLGSVIWAKQIIS